MFYNSNTKHNNYIKNITKASANLIKVKTLLGKWIIHKNFLCIPKLDTIDSSFDNNSLAVKLADSAIADFKDKLLNVKELLKNDKKRRLCRVKIKENSFVVKEFISPGPWGRYASDARSWRSAFGLQFYDIPTVKYYAWLQGKDKHGYIIMEDLGNNDVYTKLLQISDNISKVESILILIAKLLAQLHKQGIFHRDLKLVNFIVTSDEKIKLIDLDDVFFYKKIPERYAKRNFSQINNSLPEFISTEQKQLIKSTYSKCLSL